jgi:hypothetical protein
MRQMPRVHAKRSEKRMVSCLGVSMISYGLYNFRVLQWLKILETVSKPF